MDSYIPLDREFSAVPIDAETADSESVFLGMGLSSAYSWQDLESEYRNVILAEAGAGKSVELYQQALRMEKDGKYAFYLRIEDLLTGLQASFEVGGERFKDWLSSTEEGWFFLDSVDEARLESPDALRKALKLFAQEIRTATQRAHITLSSRPYAWRATADRELLDRLFYLPARQTEDEEGDTEEKSALRIYAMRPLDEDRVRRFCLQRKVNDVDRLLREIERANLFSLAERPFDLENILLKWADDRALDGRLELLEHNIKSCLSDAHDVDRSQKQPLNLNDALSGARRLAAAVLLIGETSIAVPDSRAVRPGIDPEKVLPEWDPSDVRALLERGIFNDILYGAVRFRHREVRELLAAQWFEGLLSTDTNRRRIEALFFRELYGEKIIPPRLRTILPWLILYDPRIRDITLKQAPEIAVEGGEPAKLPIETRKSILVDIVDRIARNEDSRSARDTNAIARIANPGLKDDAQSLIDKYIDNDDAIFFLGRLVWQGEMSECAASFINIATDATRNVYARVVSVRTVLTCGTLSQQQILWDTLNSGAETIPRELLAEIAEFTGNTSHDVERLLNSLNRLPPYERFKGTGLGRSLNHFIDRLSENEDPTALVQLVEGLHQYLEHKPFIKSGECNVSEEYAWLLNPATRAVESLIMKRHEAALDTPVLSILMNVPSLKFWTGSDYSEYKGGLQSLIPSWPELNDTLFWASIKVARKAQKERNGERLIDTCRVSWLAHYWVFSEVSFSRLLDYATSREDLDDRLVALSAAHAVYTETGKPEALLNELKSTVAHDTALTAHLAILLKPPVTDDMKKYHVQQARREKAHALERQQQEQARESWISALCDDPNRLFNLPDPDKGGILNDHLWLMHELQDGLTSRSECADWKALIPDFGENVARAYADAAVHRWRTYTPAIRSETPYDNSIPYALIYAMAGISIEASEDATFPTSLDADEVRHLLRYSVWELNGLPDWFERVCNVFPEATVQFVTQELIWELEHTDPEQSMHYILDDMVSRAPWLHSRLATVILDWLQENTILNHYNRQSCLHILVSGRAKPSQLVEVARHQITTNTDVDSVADWFSLYVDCDPTAGIPELSQWLLELEDDKATHAAQVFVTSLVGGHHRHDRGASVGNFKKAEHLKSLYLLMHQYIRKEDDIQRAGQGSYSPVLRDDAQEARNLLFNALNELPGKESYMAIRGLIEEHPDEDARVWMSRHAYDHAVRDGDIEPWSEEQIVDLESRGSIVPQSHFQLFDAANDRLLDIKGWVEHGNDSPAKTWRKVDDENEMRNLITGALNQRRLDQYTTAQEPEIANSQRMDIWLHNTYVDSPVPIEMKLLDKNWSGPKLCERLKNQLIGSYMREQEATCGIMLLVWTGARPNKRWTINSKRVSLDDITTALRDYWQSIASDHPDIDEIQVVLIDLSMRDQPPKS